MMPVREPSARNLSDLDVKGREISGLEPKLERFSRLPEEQVETLAVNGKIRCNIDLRETMLFVHPQGGDVRRLVAPPHWRSVTQEGVEASVETKHGREHYYEANTKGIGYLKPTVKGGRNLDAYANWVRLDEYGLKGGYGLADHEDFFDSKGADLVKRTKQLTDLGLRTELYWMIGKLKSVYYQGQLVSVQSLREQGVIPSATQYRPEIGVRLMKTNTRIAEVAESDIPRAKHLLAQAYEVFNKETKDKDLPYLQLTPGEPQSDALFFKVFAQRMGENLAVLVNNGYIGWHLHSANTTMAAEIVDVGPVMTWRDDHSEEGMEVFNGVRRATLKDLRDIAYSLRMLYQAGRKLGASPGSAEEFCDAFTRAFDQLLDDTGLEKKQKTQANDLRNAARRIFQSVLVENKKLGAIKHGYDVTDWNIGFQK